VNKGLLGLTLLFRGLRARREKRETLVKLGLLALKDHKDRKGIQALKDHKEILDHKALKACRVYQA
jgi:hypothetical protein